MYQISTSLLQQRKYFVQNVCSYVNRQGLYRMIGWLISDLFFNLQSVGRYAMDFMKKVLCCHFTSFHALNKAGAQVMDAKVGQSIYQVKTFL